MVQRYVVPNGIVQKVEQCKSKSLPHLRRFIEETDYLALEQRCKDAEKRSGDRWKELDAERQSHTITKRELETENAELRKRLEKEGA